MKIKWNAVAVCLIFLMAHAVAFGQNLPKVTASFRNVLFKEAVKTFQEESGYRFYYIPAETDSMYIHAEVSNLSLDKALEEILRNSELKYTIAGKNVYILKNRALVTALPSGFFDDKAAEDDSTAFKEAAALLTKAVSREEIELKEILIGDRTQGRQGGSAVISGYIRSRNTGEPIAGASIEAAGTGTSTNQYGYFTLTLPRGRHELSIQSIGFRNTKRNVVLYGNGSLDVEMQEEVMSLKEVVISASQARNVRSVELGVERLNIATIKQIPAVFGETDILKVLVTLPGVKTVGEASTGFNVRGGAADQNLILFNDATIYNPSHFFGFFSAFNPDVVRDLELYKSSIPAKFGGRLSSVLEITGREGNKKEFHGVAGIGLLTSRLHLEGPLKKDKTSFILGGRTTYAQWLLGMLPDEFKNSDASFYDVNLMLSHEFDKKNNLYFTGYFSNDIFNLNADTLYGYSNRNALLKWKHDFNKKLTGAFVAGFDNYRYNIKSNENPATAYKLYFSIQQLNLKSDFIYYMNPEHTVNFGASYIRYKLEPGNYRPWGKESLIQEDIIPSEHGMESAVYLSDEYKLSSGISLSGGVRYSMFNFLGPSDVNIYLPGMPKSEFSLLETRNYGNGKIVKTYHGPEFRFSARFTITPTFSVKGGYNTLRQYIHMLSNTTAISPTDIWKLSDMNIQPQEGGQASLGLYKNFKNNTIETSVEVYYKKMKNYLDYKSGASLVLNPSIEQDVISTRGKAYGVEVLVRKLSGKFNGWVSYTYSRTLLKQDDPFAGEVVNGGEFYPGNYDKPHDATVVANYKFSHRFSISVNATYSTGRPITLPIGRYYYAGSERVIYSDRNAYRIPDYFRTDFSMNIEGNHKLHQKTHNSWTIGLYNVTGRKNPYSVYFLSEGGMVNGYKLSIFGSIIPFINYNIRF